MKKLVLICSMALLASLVAATPGAPAERLLRLPADLVLQSAGGSPGPVTFSHATHVDAKAPQCTTCHPAMFPILKTNARRAAPILHAGMEKGRACGACHNDKAAFGLNECALCHRGG